MNSFVRRLILLSFVLLMPVGNVTGADASTGAAKKPLLTVKVCTINVAIPPIIGSKQVPGLLREIIDSAAVDSAIVIEYHYLPWLRCLDQVKRGNLDAAFNLTRTAERNKYFAFPESDKAYLYRAIYLLYMKNNGPFHKREVLQQLTHDGQGWDFENYNHYRQYGLSAPLGFFTYDILKQNNAIPFPQNIDKGLLLVSLDRLDGYICERFSGWSSAKHQGIEKNLFQASVMHSESEHIAFNQEFYEAHRNTVNAFWENLEPHRKRVIAEYLHLNIPIFHRSN